MSALWLVGVGIALIIAEIFFGSFFLLFVGIGLLVTAGIEAVGGFYIFDNPLIWQSASICLFSLLSLLLLRKPIKSWFKNSQVYEDSLQKGGIGEIRQGMVYFKGALWAYELASNTESASKKEANSNDKTKSARQSLQEGTRVKVCCIKENKVLIEL